MQSPAPARHLRLIAANGVLVAPPAAASLAEALVDLSGVRPGLRVLELTFGPTRLAWRFQAAGCEVAGVDLAATPSDLFPLAWRGAFDIAITTCSLHQVADPEQLLSDVAACVRPGGICAGLEPSNDDFDSADVHAGAAAAGLVLLDTDQQALNTALIWRARVPALESAQPPRLALAA